MYLSSFVGSQVALANQVKFIKPIVSQVFTKSRPTRTLIHPDLESTYQVRPGLITRDNTCNLH
jgi:hypothetical protein